MISSFLVFHLAGRLFGAKLHGAIEIFPWRASRSVPLSYPYVEGLIDYRGTVYPIFSLIKRLGLNRPAPIGFAAETNESTGAGQSIILLEEKKIPFGIVVDGVARMALLEESTSSPAEAAPDVDPHYVKGVVFENDLSIMILDFERLFHAG